MITKQQAAKLKMLVSDLAEAKSDLDFCYHNNCIGQSVKDSQNTYAAALEAFDSFVTSITED